MGRTVKNGRTSVTDEHDLDVQLRFTVIQGDRWITVELRAIELQVIVDKVHNFINQKLKYRNTSAREVPIELTSYHKEITL